MIDEVVKYLNDILKAIDRIERFIGTPREFGKYQQNIMLRQAVERNIEIIGEALNNALKLDSSLPISNARKIVDTRNKIIHGYDEVENVIVWSIIIKHLPVLKTEVITILSKSN
jgi:uncharacterized protein with HEPN domain